MMWNRTRFQTLGPTDKRQKRHWKKNVFYIEPNCKNVSIATINLFCLIIRIFFNHSFSFNISSTCESHFADKSLHCNLEIIWIQTRVYNITSYRLHITKLWLLKISHLLLTREFTKHPWRCKILITFTWWYSPSQSLTQYFTTISDFILINVTFSSLFLFQQTIILSHKNLIAWL